MIAHVDNRITYNGNGNATEFAYQFKILDRTDLKVMLVKPDGSTQILSKDYYVDVEKKVVIYPGYAPGAEIPESERPPVLPAGWRLVLYREVPIAQLVRLPEIWPFNVIEAMADKLTIICQQLKDKLSRALTINESSASNIDTTVPWVPGKTFRVSDDGTHLQATEDPGKVIDEAKGLLAETTIKAEETATNAQEAKQAAAEIKTIYNSGGLTPITDLMGSIGTALKRWGYIFANKVFATNLPIVYKSVAEMKADSLLSAGMTACTLGYYAINDGGAGTYIIRAKQASDVDDGGSLHELVNGNVAELVVENGTVNVKQFGAKGDGVTDDTDAFIKALDYVDTVSVPNGNYILTAKILLKQGKTLVGNGKATKLIRVSKENDSGDFIGLSAFATFLDCTIEVRERFKGSTIKISDDTLTDVVYDNTPVLNSLVNNVYIHFVGKPADKHASAIELSVKNKINSGGSSGFFGATFKNIFCNAHPTYNLGYFVRMFAKPQDSWITGCIFDNCIVDSSRWAFFMGAENDEEYSNAQIFSGVSEIKISNSQSQSKKGVSKGCVYIGKHSYSIVFTNFNAWDWTTKNDSPIFFGTPYIIEKSSLGQNGNTVNFYNIPMSINGSTLSATMFGIMDGDEKHVVKLTYYDWLKVFKQIVNSDVSKIISFLPNVRSLGYERFIDNAWKQKKYLRLLHSDKRNINDGSSDWLGLYFKHSYKNMETNVMIVLNVAPPYVVVDKPLGNDTRFFYHHDAEGVHNIYMKSDGVGHGYVKQDVLPNSQTAINNNGRTHNSAITIDTFLYDDDEVEFESIPEDAIELEIKIRQNNCCVQSPNGTMFSISVSDNGVLTANKILQE